MKSALVSVIACKGSAISIEKSAFLSPLTSPSRLGDGVLHRTIARVQKMYFDPPYADGRMPRVSKWER